MTHVRMGNSLKTESKATMETEIKVHNYSSDPDEYWKRCFKSSNKVIEIDVEWPSTEVSTDKLRFVCMSDTHSQTSRLTHSVPEGDVFIHAGDFTGRGQLEQVRAFNSWLGELPHKHKIVIAGNHELEWDSDSKDLKSELTNCTYLEDSSVEIHGLKIYGSPYQPEFGRWAFNLERGQECLDKWNQIPSDTDILVTHGPPLGFGDLCKRGNRAGCVDLLHTVQQRVKPKYHVFGHIHEAYGLTSDGETIFVNASTCNLQYHPTNPAIVFDVDISDGHSKDDTT